MGYTVKTICEIIGGTFGQFNKSDTIEHLLLDSRKIYFPSYSLFFALKSPRRDGHQFIPELYSRGVRNFIVSENINLSLFPEANFIVVSNVLESLQQLAAYHRNQYKIPVIGITGSNGKTIVKEWLYQLLEQDYNIVRSPKSYNSQIGVPLSVWQMNGEHALAIFEAGISQAGEMEMLENIIHPTIGVLTNIGVAHDEGFSSQKEKAKEKCKLFKNSQALIFSKDETAPPVFLWDEDKNLLPPEINMFHWSRIWDASLHISEIIKEKQETKIKAKYGDQDIAINIPFTDDASIENAVTCWCVLLHLEIANEEISKRMKKLLQVNMRLELKKGINHCSIINDSYSADISSLIIALDFLEQQSAGGKKTVILSDFLQTGQRSEELYTVIEVLLGMHKVDRLIGIGSNISRYIDSSGLSKNAPRMELAVYSSIDEFKTQFKSSQFKEETILVKGARIFEFEQIVHLLELKVHQTVLEINLNAIVHNLKVYHQMLQPKTKIMAMVKALAYGSGGAEIASILQYHKVDYLGVAYVDEGIELRKAGISLPMMVMNPEERTFDLIVEYHLEPEIYSFEMLGKFDTFLKQEGLKQYPVHVEIETGMNRLGFEPEDIPKLASFIKATHSFKIQSVFSHLVASEEKEQDAFTKKQFDDFKKSWQQLQQMLGYPVISHIANSAAIVRHPELQMDMVRLGIGLYGIDTTGNHQKDLETVATLKSTVAQIKYLKAGESVGYNRRGIASKDTIVATVRIGYADGYSRKLGNGIGKMLVKNNFAPVIGSVCMDMTMIDITGITGVKEGDDVIIFGNELPVQRLAQWAQTIPYEIMTGISQRVKRVYYEE